MHQLFCSIWSNERKPVNGHKEDDNAICADYRLQDYIKRIMLKAKVHRKLTGRALSVLLWNR